MGSCGSSLNCEKCYSSEPMEGCDTEIDINPDIAGIGVLVSFLFSAIGFFAVVIWAYFQESLPLDILTPTDHYVLRLLKRRLGPFDESDLLFESTAKQKRRTRIVTGLAVVLGDQQLMTGIAVLIAGLASRCHISIYEFNIVVSLAYLAVITHAVSLKVLRRYLFDHKLVRNCRVVLTIGFLVLFGFAFVVNTSTKENSSVELQKRLNVGNNLQCIFEAPHIGKTVKFGWFKSFTLLWALFWHQSEAVIHLYLISAKDNLFKAGSTWFIHYFYPKGFSENEVYEQATALEEDRYDGRESWKLRVKVWLTLEFLSLRDYYDAFLHQIPRMLMAIAYGISRIIKAVWFGGLKPTKSFQILGFGQIVTVGLLGLTLLAAVEMSDEQLSRHDHEPRNNTASIREINGQDNNNEETSSDDTHTSDGSQPEQIVIEDNSSSTHTQPAHEISHPGIEQVVNPLESNLESDAPKFSTTPIDHVKPRIAKRIAKHTSIYCLTESFLLVFIGIGVNIPEMRRTAGKTFLVYIIYSNFYYVMYKNVNIVSLFMNFIKTRSERLRKDSLVSPLVDSGTVSPSSGQPASSAISLASIQQPPQQPGRLGRHFPSSTVQEQAQFSPPARVDTEADIGLARVTRRETFTSTSS
ncbi:hypothetical protein Ptr902_07202 [Pyrenophora tritici-repentis]|nr:hypothetical protein Ptr902_07202 [Pyrenophora tritici-repentis]